MTGRLLNVSQGGALLILGTRFRLHDQLLLRVSGDDRVVEVDAQARWCVFSNELEAWLVGCRFGRLLTPYEVEHLVMDPPDGPEL